MIALQTTPASRRPSGSLGPKDPTLSLMRSALSVARVGLQRGELPMACVVAVRGGLVVGSGHDQMQCTHGPCTHAEAAALAKAAKRHVTAEGEELVLVSTIEPCHRCTYAAVQAGVGTLIYGLPAPGRRSASRWRRLGTAAKSPLFIEGLLADECRRLLDQWMALYGREPDRRASRYFVERVLADAAA